MTICFVGMTGRRIDPQLSPTQIHVFDLTFFTSSGDNPLSLDASIEWPVSLSIANGIFTMWENYYTTHIKLLFAEDHNAFIVILVILLQNNTIGIFEI